MARTCDKLEVSFNPHRFQRFGESPCGLRLTYVVSTSMCNGNFLPMISHRLEVLKELASFHETVVDHVMNFHYREGNEFARIPEVLLNYCRVDERFRDAQ